MSTSSRSNETQNGSINRFIAPPANRLQCQSNIMRIGIVVTARLVFRSFSTRQIAIVLVFLGSTGAMVTVTCFGENERSANSDPLVSFQRDGELLITVTGEKVKWSSAIGKQMSAQGIFLEAGKDYHDRLVIDNTSVYLRWASSVNRPESGILVVVEGEWSLIKNGVRDRSVQGSALSRAYAIDVTAVKPVSRVETLVIQMTK